jgi:hypothetical protein
VDHLGPLTQKVMQYQDTVRQLVPTAKTPEDWAPLASLIAIDRFERIGTFLEVAFSRVAWIMPARGNHPSNGPTNTWLWARVYSGRSYPKLS